MVQFKMFSHLVENSSICCPLFENFKHLNSVKNWKLRSKKPKLINQGMPNGLITIKRKNWKEFLRNICTKKAHPSPGLLRDYEMHGMEKYIFSK